MIFVFQFSSHKMLFRSMENFNCYFYRKPSRTNAIKTLSNYELTTVSVVFPAGLVVNIIVILNFTKPLSLF